MEVGGHLHASAVLSCRDKPPIPIQKTSCQPQSLSWTGEKKTYLPLAWDRLVFAVSSVHSQITIPTTCDLKNSWQVGLLTPPSLCSFKRFSCFWKWHVTETLILWKSKKRSTLTFNFNFIAFPSSSKFPAPLNLRREHCMLFLLTAVTANMFHFGIFFLISWYVSYLKECVRRFVFPLQTGQNHQFFWSCNQSYHKRGWDRWETNGEAARCLWLCYNSRIIKLCNAVKRFGLRIIIGCVKL